MRNVASVDHLRTPVGEPKLEPAIRGETGELAFEALGAAIADIEPRTFGVGGCAPARDHRIEPVIAPAIDFVRKIACQIGSEDVTVGRRPKPQVRGDE